MIIKDNTVVITGADLSPGHEYEIMVQAVSSDGRIQSVEDSPKAVIVLKGRQTVPSQPSGLTATGGIVKIALNWDVQTDTDFDIMEIWRSSTDNFGVAAKVAEVKTTSWTDEIGSTGQTRYYWLIARNTSGKISTRYPSTSGIGATTTGISPTNIDDFAIDATKMFSNTIILTADVWSNNTPVASQITWNTHYLVYGGAYYRVTGSSTALRYVYWDVGHTAGTGTVADPYITTYSKSATYTTAADRFVVVVNESGVVQKVWNAAANMVIGSAFILNAAIIEAKIDNLAVTQGKIGLLAVGTAQIDNLAVTDAKIDTLGVNKLAAGTISSKSIVLAVAAGTGDTEIRAVIASGDFANTGAASGFILGLDDSDSDKAKFYIGDATHYMKWDGAALTVNGSAIANPVLTGVQAGSEVAIQGWQFTGIFSVTNYQNVYWTAGTIKLLDGTTYSILTGGTGNMAGGLYYIYLDIVVSTTALQLTQTAATAVGAGKILIGVAERNADTTSRATFQVFGGSGGQTLLVNNIAANSASTNEFVSNTAQIKNLIVTDAKISTLAVSKLTAGIMTGKTITLLPDMGGVGWDCYINSGKTDFNNVQSGFILGCDYSDSGKAKFYIGDATNYLNWTGAALNIKGVITVTAGSNVAIGADVTGDNTAADTAKVQGETIIVGGYIATSFLTADNVQAGTLTGRTVQTAASGKRVIISGSDNNIKFYSNLAGNPLVLTIDDGISGSIPGINISSANGAIISMTDSDPADAYDFILLNSYSTNKRISASMNGDECVIYAQNVATTTTDLKAIFTAVQSIGTTGVLFSGQLVGTGTVFKADSAGYVTVSVGYKVGANQVVGARGAAVADATDAASVILRLNDLLARCRAHGLVAT